MSDYRLETKCLHAGYTPSNGEPCALPIYQSTTFKYDTTDEMGQLFDLKAEGYFYTRLQNPTNDAVAAKIAELEGGVAALLTSSGQAANFYAVFNICEAGDHVVAASTIYGGTFNLLAVTFKKLGIDCTFVDTDASAEEIAAAMLRRQQAEAVIAARAKIVDGAVSMVKMAIDKLGEEEVVILDEERKAAMVSNLMVVLCSEKDTQPIVNSGSIY